MAERALRSPAGFYGEIAWNRALDDRVGALRELALLRERVSGAIILFADPQAGFSGTFAEYELIRADVEIARFADG
jgi:hypothetical protein